MASPTPNKGYTYPVHGGAVNSWDTPIDADFDQIDLNVAGPYPLTITSTLAAITYNSSFASIGSAATQITPSSSLIQNLYYNYSGVMTNDQDLVFPAVGGIYVINNGATGAFTLRAVISGSTAVNVPIAQGGSNVVIADGVNMIKADSNTVARLNSYLGNPNTHVAGTMATANGGLTDAVWDTTDQQLYIVTTTGVSSAAVWTPQLARLTPQGVLTVSANTNNPVVTNDTTSTTVNYVPFLGNWTLLSNGTILYPYQFSPMVLTLTAAQASNVIYDVFMYWNAGTPIIGTGPAWTTSTAGSGARGAGAGTTEITRLLGIWVNANQITLTNNGAPFVCPVNQGVYLGSIWIDPTAGNVTCHRSYGTNRKWGISQGYDPVRETVILQAGDPAASWNYATATIRASDGSSANSLSLFSGLPEEAYSMTFLQKVKNPGGSGTQGFMGIGFNSVTAFSGKVGSYEEAGAGSQGLGLIASLVATPSLGVQTVTCLEQGTGSGATTYFGTNTNMLLTGTWRA